MAGDVAHAIPDVVRRLLRPLMEESVPMTPTARAEIVVDLGAIRAQRAAAAPLVSAERPVQLIAIVKADGYGHGMVEAARAAREGGAEWIGVATLDEALALRAGGDAGRLLCWLTVPGEDYAAALPPTST